MYRATVRTRGAFNRWLGSALIRPKWRISRLRWVIFAHSVNDLPSTYLCLPAACVQNWGSVQTISQFQWEWGGGQPEGHYKNTFRTPKNATEIFQNVDRETNHGSTSQSSMVHYFHWVHKLKKVFLVQGPTTSQGLQCLTVSQLQQFRTFQSIHMSKDFLVVFKPKFQEQQEWHSIVSLADSSCLRSPT